jgi:GNAT superfamily N-acetyltransferase
MVRALDRGLAAASLGMETMQVAYDLDPHLTVAEFRDVLVASTLAERRPVDDPARLEMMLRQADIIVTARHQGRLVGVSRAITDFAYCCYLSDLAVDAAYQHKGIGRRLIAETHARAGEGAALILLAAPAAETYYAKIGMSHAANCWMIPRAR